MDDRDRRLLARLQEGLPLCPRPYQAIAEALEDFTEAEVIERAERLREEGLIRRMTGFFRSEALGYHSTLCAMRVDTDDIDQMAALLDKIPGVTHNYLRDHAYNMWFTLTARDRAEVSRILRAIEQTGLTDGILQMDRTQSYKIHANFTLE